MKHSIGSADQKCAMVKGVRLRAGPSTPHQVGEGVMSEQREKFSSQAAPALLSAMREAARRDGRHFQAVLEDAMVSYLESRERQRVRPEVMAHYRASVEKNRKLYELLAQ